jgi:hypothetical protein
VTISLGVPLRRGCDNLTGDGTNSTAACQDMAGNAILGGADVQIFGTDNTSP